MTPLGLSVLAVAAGAVLVIYLTAGFPVVLLVAAGVLIVAAGADL